jgi:hypothetical protein
MQDPSPGKGSPQWTAAHPGPTVGTMRERLNDRLSDWWSGLVARRGGADLLLDLWLLTVFGALFLGFVLGWAARA